MNIEIVEKKSFAVIGKMGSTVQGAGFVALLWRDANAHFGEIASLAKLDERGRPVGCWGAMSDMAMRFMPWEENFTKGLYLAGVECREDAKAPSGWEKWIIPAFRYVRVECADGDTFANGLAYLSENGFELVGAVQDFTDVATGKSYMCFPIARIS